MSPMSHRWVFTRLSPNSRVPEYVNVFEAYTLDDAVSEYSATYLDDESDDTIITAVGSSFSSDVSSWRVASDPDRSVSISPAQSRALSAAASGDQLTDEARAALRKLLGDSRLTKTMCQVSA